MVSGSKSTIILRTDLNPEDLNRIIKLHGRVYSLEYGFDHTFEDYVAAPLYEFASSTSPRARLWMAELDGRMVGCIAIVSLSADTAQLRWFLIDPDFRGMGLGKRLLQEAVAFCRDHGYKSVILWTVSFLSAAAHLYQEIGFKKREERPGIMWGVEVVEEKYELMLT